MKQHSTSPLAVLAGAVIATAALVPLAAARTDRDTRAAASTIQVKGGEFFFRLSAKSIPAPTKVTFTFKNIGTVAHDFKINGKKIPLTQPGKSATLVVTFTKKGSFPYLCTVPGHAQAGMKGVFTVK
jgi:uncharacterized cupredoxin-like copper-binding protein